MFGLRAWEKWLSRGKSQRRLKGFTPTNLRSQSAEVLEERVLLYATSGNAWPAPQLVTISFMPDGTNLGGGTSNLQSTFNTKFGAAATWQNQILKAAQQWAQQTNINFAVVTDNGTAAGSGSNQQGDPGFGDIRIGGYNFGTSTLAQSYMPPPANNYSIAGDMQFNTGTAYNIGSTYDLFTVAMHEFGHALGLLHSATTAASMYSTYSSAMTALNADDITGIKAIYSAGAARANDSYDSTSNGTTAAASVITSLINTTTKTAVINNLDLTTSTDLDFYKFVIPSGVAAGSTLKAKVVATGLSLLDAKVEILNSAGTSVANATTANGYGSTVTATYTNAAVVAGATFYVKVSSVDALAAFKTGKYALVLNMGTGADPAVTYPTTLKANGTTLTSGGGQALMYEPEGSVNVTTASDQVIGNHSIATAANGDYIVTWSSTGQDGSLRGVYARRYNADGSPQTGEFLVNQTTSDDQYEPAVAMDALGNSIIAWTSLNQDGSAGGIYARCFDANGTAKGNEFRVNSTTAGSQTSPAIASDTYGNFVITWTSSGQDGNGLGVYGQRYSLLGTTVGAEFLVNTATTGDQTNSTVVMNRFTSEFVVTWQSSAQDGSGQGIYAQRYDVSGNKAGSEFRVNTYTTGDQTDPCIAINRFTGEFVVTWTSAAQDGSGTGIYAQRYNATGVVQGSAFLVNTTTTGDQNDSSVAVDAAGHILVTWSSLNSNAAIGWQVLAQQFTSSGVKNEGEFNVNATSAGDQKGSSIAISFLGKVVIGWSGSGSNDTSGVYKAVFRLGADSYEPGAAVVAQLGSTSVVIPNGTNSSSPMNSSGPVTSPSILSAFVESLDHGSLSPVASSVSEWLTSLSQHLNSVPAHHDTDSLFGDLHFRSSLLDGLTQHNSLGSVS